MKGYSSLVFVAMSKRLFVCFIIFICLQILFITYYTSICYSNKITNVFCHNNNFQIILQQLNISIRETINMCKSVESEKTIVLVPYRNRKHNLELFISPIHEQMTNQVFYVISYFKVMFLNINY